MQSPDSKLIQFISDQSEVLQGTLRFYVISAGLAERTNAEQIASELLNEVVVEALEDQHKFDPARSPMAWLLGIAANLIKRKQVTSARRNRREPLMRDLLPSLESNFSDGELSDWLSAVSTAGQLDDVDSDDAIATLLRGLSEADRTILRLAVLHDMDGNALAEALGVGPGAARMRLHRAIIRLRTRYLQEDMTHE